MKTIYLFSLLSGKTGIYNFYSKYSFYLFILLVLGISSCKSFLDVDLPKSQLVNSAVFDNYETATIAMTDIYSKIRDKGILSGTGYGGSYLLGVYTDELLSYGPQTDEKFNFYHNTLLPSSFLVSGFWNNTYNQIYAANSVIEGVELSKGLTLAEKQELKGEALFVRALLHFYLVNLFGDIPYITQTDYRTNIIVTRNSTENVYKLIIADIKKSMELLSKNYVASDKVIPNQSAAMALLARVYLYEKSWPEAENIASSLINEVDLFTFDEHIDEVFLIGSAETIWQLQAGNAGQNSMEGSVFIFTSGPPPNISLSPNLFNSFSDEDLRKSNWIKAITNGTTTWYHPNKYKEQFSTPTSKEYSIVFRLTEQYLIRAEARAQQENLNGAKEDLNKIRHRAGLDDIPALDKTDVLEAIMQERRWEFFTEYGHRFFDLKRKNQLDQALSGVKPGWNNTDRLFPIPQIELNTNPNLRPQNPGY